MLIIIGFLIIVEFRNGVYLYFHEFIHFKAIINVLIHINLYIFNCSTILSLVFWKTNKWKELLKRLKTFISITDNFEKIKFFCLISFGILLVTVMFTISMLCFWSWINGVERYLLRNNAVYLQYFLITAFHIYTTFILKLFLWQYHKLTITMGNMTNCKAQTLAEIEDCVYFLRDTVDCFNEIFSWPLTLNISFTVLYTLNNLDFVFETPKIYTNVILWRITFDVAMAAIFFVSFTIISTYPCLIHILGWFCSCYFNMRFNFARKWKIIGFKLHTEKKVSISKL